MRTLDVEVRWAKIALYFYVAQAAAGAAIGFAIPFLHLIAERLGGVARSTSNPNRGGIFGGSE
jgi:glucose uptake protein GlcU